jgi:hypothetical protein
MATTDISASKRPIAVANSPKLNRRRLRFRRSITASTIVGSALIGLLSYAIHDDSPGVQALRTDAIATAAIVIFAATYLVIAVGKLPGFHLDRAGAALLGEDNATTVWSARKRARSRWVWFWRMSPCH